MIFLGKELEYFWVRGEKIVYSDIYMFLRIRLRILICFIWVVKYLLDSSDVREFFLWDEFKWFYEGGINNFLFFIFNSENIYEYFLIFYVKI